MNKSFLIPMILKWLVCWNYKEIRIGFQENKKAFVFTSPEFMYLYFQCPPWNIISIVAAVVLMPRDICGFSHKWGKTMFSTTLQFLWGTSFIINHFTKSMIYWHKQKTLNDNKFNMIHLLRWRKSMRDVVPYLLLLSNQSVLL